MNWETKQSVKVLLVFGIVLYMTSIAIYFIGGFAWLYLAVANILGIAIVYSGSRLVISSTSRDAWRLYKLSAFPYLGVIFLAMCIDIWIPV